MCVCERAERMKRRAPLGFGHVGRLCACARATLTTARSLIPSSSSSSSSATALASASSFASSSSSSFTSCFCSCSCFVLCALRVRRLQRVCLCCGRCCCCCCSVGTRAGAEFEAAAIRSDQIKMNRTTRFALRVKWHELAEARVEAAAAATVKS